MAPRKTKRGALLCPPVGENAAKMRAQLSKAIQKYNEKAIFVLYNDAVYDMR